MAVYIWSDLHLNHDNIRLYEKRPFDSEEAMNQAIIRNWKTTIKKGDIILNLGDVSWRLNKEWMSKTIRNLPGYKVLVLGNHDRGKSLKWWMDVGFDEVYKYPIIYENFFILSHEPMYVNDTMPYVNIHGHTHGETLSSNQHWNVSVERQGYKPMLFEKIRAYYTPAQGED